LEDYDFHPDETTVRLFRIPEAGVLRLDDEIAVYQVAYEDNVVLRHYAFADRWYKVNVTTDASGNLIETGEANQRFAFNCDIATPMDRDGTQLFAVDLFLDVLVRDDASTLVVGDEDEFDAAVEQRLISATEARAARAGLGELLELIDRGQLLSWLGAIVPFDVCAPPNALGMTREEVPARVRSERRASW
jgi:predicted RNA-binding protein associated with RNAse of E/G family